MGLTRLAARAIVLFDGGVLIHIIFNNSGQDEFCLHPSIAETVILSDYVYDE